PTPPRAETGQSLVPSQRTSGSSGGRGSRTHSGRLGLLSGLGDQNGEGATAKGADAAISGHVSTPRVQTQTEPKVISPVDTATSQRARHSHGASAHSET